MTITEAIRKISKHEIYESIIGTVVSIDTDSLTCEVNPIDDQPNLLDVRFSAVENPPTGIIPVPVIDSIVIVSQTATGQQFISLFSEIDTYQITANQFTFNDGRNGGLVIIGDLVTKINNLENQVNNILTALKTHTHAGVTTGGGVSGTSPSFSSITNLTNTQVSDLEDAKVKH